MKVTKKFILCGQHKDFISSLIAKGQEKLSQGSTEQDVKIRSIQARRLKSNLQPPVMGSMQELSMVSSQKLTHKKYMEDR